METLGSRLKLLREAKNLTQTELSQMLELKTYTTVSKWESDDNSPRGKELMTLAKLFNVTTDYLLCLSDDPNGRFGEESIEIMKKNFAKNLKVQLYKNNIIHADLAKELNLPKTTVSDWLNSKTYPEFDEMQMIADYFNVSKSYLQEDHNEMDLELSEIERLLSKMSKEEKKRLIKIMKATFDLED